MDFPTFEKNATQPTQALVVDAPDFDPNDTRSAEERWIDQQWRDVEEQGIGATHPLSLNRDSAHVTTDPYDVA